MVIIAIAYIRVTLVVARREELLEEQNPAPESNQRSAWLDLGVRRVVSNTKATRVVRLVIPALIRRRLLDVNAASTQRCNEQRDLFSTLILPDERSIKVFWETRPTPVRFTRLSVFCAWASSSAVG